MELRRALLLFAIVLGVAAVVTSFSAPADRQRSSGRNPGGTEARAEPAPPAPKEISFSATGRPRSGRLAAGRPGVVVVKVARAGQVELKGLGLSSPAEPLTPARIEVFERRTGSYEIRFSPAESNESWVIGELEIVE